MKIPWLFWKGKGEGPRESSKSRQASSPSLGPHLEGVSGRRERKGEEGRGRERQGEEGRVGERR
jgi:hypothetical protein